MKKTVKYSFLAFLYSCESVLLKTPKLHFIAFSIVNTAVGSYYLLVHKRLAPRRYVVDDKRRVVYIINSKVACTSIKELFLKTHKLGDYDIHYEVRGVRKLTSVQKKYFTFSFVRNPFERLVSCYLSKYDLDFNRNKRRLDFDFYLFSLFRKKTSFEKFVKKVCAVPEFLANDHFKSQYALLYHNSNCLADYVGKLETISKDFLPIQKKYHFRSLRKRNASSKGNWQNFYTDELVNLVYNRYERDIIAFDYILEYDDLKRHVARIST